MTDEQRERLCNAVKPVYQDDERMFDEIIEFFERVRKIVPNQYAKNRFPWQLADDIDRALETVVVRKS